MFTDKNGDCIMRSRCAPCPECGCQPRLKKSFFKLTVQLQCDCGVSGSEALPQDREYALWDAAITGWPFKKDKLESKE